MPWLSGHTSIWPLTSGPLVSPPSSGTCVNRSNLSSRRLHNEPGTSARNGSPANGSATATCNFQSRTASTKLCALSVAHTEASVNIDNVKFAAPYVQSREGLTHGTGHTGASDTTTSSTSERGLDKLWLGKSPSEQQRHISHSRRKRKSKFDVIRDVDNAAKTLLGKRARIWKQKPVPKTLSASRLNNVLNYGDTMKLVFKFHDLSEQGHLDAALLVAEKLSRLCAADVQQGNPCAWNRLIQKKFLSQARRQKAVDAALHFIHLLPEKFADKRTFSMVLSVCSAASNPNIALAVADLAQQRGLKLDVMHFTNLITACSQQGLAERAIKLFNELKLNHQRSLDAWVYCALMTAFARSIELQPAHDSKQRLVLLERAFGMLEEALRENSTHLTAPVFNALLNCAVHCNQSERAFKVLELMQFHGCRPTVETYGALIEVCVRTKQPRLGMKMFEKALQTGFGHDIQIYTLALRTCMVNKKVSPSSLKQALSIYRMAVTREVPLDDLFWGHFLALLGRAGKVDLCIAMLRTYLKTLPQGRVPTTAIVSAVMSCCMSNANHYSAELVYNLARKQGVLPSVQQFNRLMFCYSRERRLSAVVTLACDMLRAGVEPTPTTFAVLLGACEKTDQVELAFELIANMKQRKMSVEMMHLWILAKLCFNRIRYSWYPPMSHPGARFQGPVRPAILTGQALPTLYIPVVRRNEAQQLLSALGCADCDTVGAATSAAFGTHRKARRTGLPGVTSGPATPPSLDFLGAGSSSGHWSSRLLGVYREAVASGLKPSLKLMDRILACLRLQFKGAKGRPGTFGGAGEHGFMGAVPLELARSLPFINMQPAGVSQSKFEVPFSPRAFSVVEEAISQDFLPGFALDSPVTLDIRTFGPTLAEVYVLYIFQMLERRSATSGRALTHPIALLVPAWDPDYVMWPHLVERINRRADVVPEPVPVSAIRGRGVQSASMNSQATLQSHADTQSSTSGLQTLANVAEFSEAAGNQIQFAGRGDVGHTYKVCDGVASDTGFYGTSTSGQDAHYGHGSSMSHGFGPSQVDVMMKHLMARNVPGSGLGNPLSTHDWGGGGSFDEDDSNTHHVLNTRSDVNRVQGVAKRLQAFALEDTNGRSSANGHAVVDQMNRHAAANGHGVLDIPAMNGLGILQDSVANGSHMDRLPLPATTGNGNASEHSLETSNQHAEMIAMSEPPSRDHAPEHAVSATSVPLLHANALPQAPVTSPSSITVATTTCNGTHGPQSTVISHTSKISSAGITTVLASASTPYSPASRGTAVGATTPLSSVPSSGHPGKSSRSVPHKQAESSRTGLAVAATLKRMKIRASMDHGLGLIVLDPREVNRWARSKLKYESQLKHHAQQAPAFAQQLHHVVGPTPWLTDQQRNIRMGFEADMVVPPPRSL